MFKTKKGQAAITDALFFLLIIVTLSVLMFRYSSTYGNRIEQATTDLYFKEYTNSVLKTIFYTSVPLDFDLNLESAKETDYLMTQIKQDYFSDGNIGYSDINQLGRTDYRDLAKYNLYNTVKALMFPLKSHDYVFYLYDQEGDKFIYFMIKNTNYQLSTSPSQNSPYVVKYIVPEEDLESFYLCDPNGYNIVRQILSKSPKIFSSSIPLNFIRYVDQININVASESTIIGTFAIWPSTVDINKDIIESQLNCNFIEH